MFNFNPALYDVTGDTTNGFQVKNAGFEIAGNNKYHPTAGVSDSTLKGRQWGVSPRVGFAMMFTPQIGIWPRAGITYLHVSIDDSYTNPTTGVKTTNTTSVSQLSYTMDVNLIIAPIPHVGFTVGPTFDYLLSQSESQTPPDTTPNSNYKAHALGLQAGIFVWF